MLNARPNAAACALLIIPVILSVHQAAPQSGRTLTLSGEMQRGYSDLQRDLAEAAAKMPEEHYGFRPTPDIKPFGQLVAHIALAQFRTCAMLKGEPNPRNQDKEEVTLTKSQAIALLQASAHYCDPLVSALTDATMSEIAISGQNQIAKGLLPASLVAHGSEMYGTMAVYLRLKGIVPPTTERQNRPTK